MEDGDAKPESLSYIDDKFIANLANPTNEVINLRMALDACREELAILARMPNQEPIRNLNQVPRNQGQLNLDEI